MNFFYSFTVISVLGIHKYQTGEFLHLLQEHKQTHSDIQYLLKKTKTASKYLIRKRDRLQIRRSTCVRGYIPSQGWYLHLIQKCSSSLFYFLHRNIIFLNVWEGSVSFSDMWHHTLTSCGGFLSTINKSYKNIADFKHEHSWGSLYSNGGVNEMQLWMRTCCKLQQLSWNVGGGSGPDGATGSAASLRDALHRWVRRKTGGATQQRWREKER